QSGVNRVFEGDLGELLIFNTALSDSDIQKIEGYLAHKWGLYQNLPSSHPYSLGAPVASSGTPDYITDTPFGSGKAIDLANGHVEIPTGEAEDVFDGGAAFSVSAWVKGASKQALGSIISKGAGRGNNMFQAPITLWVDATASDTITTDSSGNLLTWQNLVDPTVVLEGHSSYKPTIGTATINGLEAVEFDRQGRNRMERVVAKQNGANWNPGGPVGVNHKPTDIAVTLVAQIDVQRRNNFPFGFGWGDHFAWSNGYIYWRYTGGRSQFLAYTTGVPNVLTMHFSKTDGVQKAYVNGSQTFSKARTDDANSNIGSNFVWPDNVNNNSYSSDWRLGEMIVTRGYFPHSAREAIEGYLAGKWGLNDQLPSSHSGKDWSDTNGWALTRELSSNSLATNLPGLSGVTYPNHGADFETDNNWHHLVVSFNGNTQKFYIDAVEKDSTSISGSIGASVSALVLGAYDRNATAAPSDEIKNVAAAGHSGVKLDEVRFYNKGLTATEVSDIYNYGKGDLQKIGGFSTIPTTVTATVGSAFSNTVTADFSNPVYEAYNLPNGLSINSSTGEISGTPTVGGSHILTVTAEGGSNEAPKKAVATITYTAGSSAPHYDLPGAQNIVGDSALLLIEIAQSGAPTNTVDLVWDTSDKGTSNLTDWNGSATSVGTGNEGFYGKLLSDLTPGGTYYYRAKATAALNPLDLASTAPKLWLDAADLSTAGPEWTDKSGSNNSATRVGSPAIVTNAQNGLSVMRYSADGQFHHFPTMTDIRTVFWVLKRTGTDTENRFLLGHHNGSTYHFHASGTKFYNNTHAHNNVKNGTTRLNGTSINGGNTDYPSSMSVISLKTNGDVTASAFSRDRTMNARVWKGDLGELLIYNTALTDSEISSIEGYLAHKWGVEGSLASSHTWKSAPPTTTSWSNLQSFTTPINTSAPTLGAQSTANLDKTSADIQVVLSDNGNAASTVVFYWGDNDGGTNTANWDSNVTISNAPEGTNLRASLTGLTSGNTYYFRAWATNTANKGNDWADSTLSFTTVTSTVREDTDAIRYSDLEGWWKLDSNLLDSSGNNRHGSLSTNPAYDSLVWLDAADESTITHSSNAVSKWADKTGNGNHATQATAASKPTYSSADKKITFDGGDILQITTDPFNGIQEPAVFAVLKWNALNNWANNVASFHGESNIGWQLRQRSNQEMLTFTIRRTDGTDDPTTTSSPDLTDATFLLSAYRKDNIRTLRFNGEPLFSFADTGSITYSGSGKSAIGGRFHGNSFQTPSGYLKGNLHEVIVFNSVLPDQVTQVESYLAEKWGLTNNLYYSPVALSGFSTDTISGTGSSLDLSDGTFAQISTGGSETVFDGGSTFSTSLWVKGWPENASQPLLSKQSPVFAPSNFSDIKVWFDATDLNADGTTDTTASGNITSWSDKSGNDYDTSAVAGTPYLNKTGGPEGMQSIEIRGGDYLTVSGSFFVKDMFFVFRSPPANTVWSGYGGPFGRNPASGNTLRNSNYITQHNNTTFHSNQYPAAIWRFGTSIASPFSLAPITDYMVVRLQVNNNDTSNHNLHQIGRVTGLQCNLDICEILGFGSALPDADADLVEGFLAHKWGLSSGLDNSHTYKLVPVIAGTSDNGWALKRHSSDQDSLTLNLEGTNGDLSSNVAVNDGQWHHIATTFGGGSKKIYVDGVQVATASNTGSVDADIAKFALGSHFGNSGLEDAKIDDVRFYSAVLSAAEVAAIYNKGAGDIGQPKFAITSPASLTATAGRSISYQITVDPAYGMTGYNSTVSYELLNAPSWLSVGSSSGTVTGTPPAAGTYTFQVKGSNTLGSNVKDVTLTAISLTDWNYALSFTTDYSGGTPLKDWNMLVRFSEDSSTGAGTAGFRYSQTNSNGGDLRFISKSGEELKYEIAKWNTAGESQVWVRVPSLASDANITAYWGNTSAGLPSYANDGSVWDGYFGVYHLEQTTGAAKDSSAFGNDLPSVNSPTLVSSGFSGSSYSITSSAANGFMGAISGYPKARDGTYSIWTKNASGLASSRQPIGASLADETDRQSYSEDIGWKFSHLTGDSDSGISSSYTYTSAINVNGSNKTINGVTFTGATGTSGTGWAITQGWGSTHASTASTVGGQIGSLLSNGLRFNGDPQKIKMTGLTDGKAYVFSVYSQAWEASGRVAVLSCSEHSDTLTIDQDLYSGTSQDGLLVECTYIADGTEAEFTFNPDSSTWHLYGFSNREATPLTPNLSGNGSWRQSVVTIKDGYFNYYLDGSVVGSAAWHFPGEQTIANLALGRTIKESGPDGTVDEATFSNVPRSSDWITASYNNQKPSSAYLNFETLLGPISLNDPDNTKIFGKKDTTITSYTVGHSGSGSFTATGLPTGLSINSATGVISGTTSVIGTQNVTITATGTTAGGGTVTVSKIYVVSITDPSSFPYRMDLTISASNVDSNLTDFPLLVSLSTSITGFSYNGFLDSDGDGVRTGGDLRFFAASGQELAYEIADWNTS
ncbi:MAG: DUF2341 domain-containing protein, partial [Opitutae bacterium]